VCVCGERSGGAADLAACGFGIGVGAFVAGVIIIPGVCMWPEGVRGLDFVEAATRFRFALRLAFRLGAAFALGFALLTPPMTCPSCCPDTAGDEARQNNIISDQLISFLNIEKYFDITPHRDFTPASTPSLGHGFSLVLRY
jgi:hypothetical protein